MTEVNCWPTLVFVVILGDVLTMLLLIRNDGHLLSYQTALFLRYAPPVVFLWIEFPKWPVCNKAQYKWRAREWGSSWTRACFPLINLIDFRISTLQHLPPFVRPGMCIYEVSPGKTSISLKWNPPKSQYHISERFFKGHVRWRTVD